MSELTPNTEEALRFLKGWCGPHLCVLTAIFDGGRIETAVFTEHMDVQLERWFGNRQGKANIYFTPNIVSEAFAEGTKPKKPKKTDIVGALGLHIDIDPRPGFDIAEEQERILGELRSYHLPPTVIIFSGGGYQALWRLREPFLINGDPLNVDLIEAQNRKLAADLGGDNTHNIDRILRVPGTINILDERKRAKGRVPATARLMSWN
jgi:hypothetical protein